MLDWAARQWMSAAGPWTQAYYRTWPPKLAWGYSGTEKHAVSPKMLRDMSKGILLRTNRNSNIAIDTKISDLGWPWTRIQGLTNCLHTRYYHSQERVKLRTSTLACTFTGSMPVASPEVRGWGQNWGYGGRKSPSGVQGQSLGEWGSGGEAPRSQKTRHKFCA